MKRLAWQDRPRATAAASDRVAPVPRIVDAAARLFVDHGYVATTIEAVAELAGVAVQTVYYVFGTKRNLLAAVLDASIAGDVGAGRASSIDRGSTCSGPSTTPPRRSSTSSTRRWRSWPAPRRSTRSSGGRPPTPRWARCSTTTAAGGATTSAAWSRSSGRSGHLRPDLDVDTAADVVYGLLNEEVFQLLTVDCGWSVERFRRWATSLMMQQLTAAPPG